MSGAPIVFATQPQLTPRMTLSTSGNLGIGATNAAGTVTLSDGSESVTLTIAMVKGLQELRGFLDYAESCDSEIGTLWRAYKIANKLE